MKPGKCAGDVLSNAEIRSAMERMKKVPRLESFPDNNCKFLEALIDGGMARIQVGMVVMLTAKSVVQPIGKTGKAK